MPPPAKFVRWMIVVIGVGVATGFAQEAPSTGVAEPVAEWRTVVPSEFAFKPAEPVPEVAVNPARPAVDLNVLAAKAHANEPEEKVVEMPVVIVNSESYRLSELGRELERQAAQAKTDEQLRRTRDKLGVGVYTFEKGNFGAAAVTVFHIPVFVSAGWSW